MKAEVDKNLCIGCGNCANKCPKCFEILDDGKSHVKEDCKEGDCDLKAVADDCPVSAISVE